MSSRSRKKLRGSTLGLLLNRRPILRRRKVQLMSSESLLKKGGRRRGKSSPVEGILKDKEAKRVAKGEPCGGGEEGEKSIL